MKRFSIIEIQAAVVLCAAALLASGLWAQARQHSFARLGVDQGLCSAEVRVLKQDRFGFLWIGTGDGLDVHDGYGFVHYQRQPFDSTSVSANAITALFEDRQGTMWIGTVHGLCRMNAQERAAGRFHQFLHNPADPASLSDNAISAIGEDAAGNLWIATTGGGLNRLDHLRNGFVHYRRELGNPFGLNDDVVFALHCDRAGTLWVGTARGGLQKFDSATERFSTYTWQHPDHLQKYVQYSSAVFSFVDSLQTAQMPLAAILRVGDNEERTETFSLSEDSRALVIATGEAIAQPMADFAWLERPGDIKPAWQMSLVRSKHGGGAVKNRLAIEVIDLRAGTYALHYRSDDSHSSQKWNAWPPHHPELWGAQVFRLEAASAGKIAALLPQTHRPSALSHARVHAIIDDPQPGSRVMWIATASGLNRFDTAAETFTRYYRDSSGSGAASANFITALAAQDSGGLWVATGAGIDCVDTQRKHLARRQPADAVRNPPRGRINALLTDDASILWVGTQGEGLYKLVPRKFSHHLLSHGGPSNQIFAIEQAGDGQFWLGTAAGLVSYDRHTSRTRHFKHDPQNPNSLSTTSVSSIHQDQYGNLWIGTHGGGLNRFVPAAGKFVHYRHARQDTASLSSDFISCIAEDRSGALWIGTAFGLNRFDTATDRAQRFLHDPNDPRSIPANEVFSLLVDRGGTLWAGTALGGLSQVDPATGRCRNYIHDPNDQHSLSNRTVNALHQDRACTLWIGTYSGGLCALRRDEQGRERFINYTVADGLPSNKIQGILEDEEGRLWLSTNNGIACFDPARSRFRLYATADGMQHAQFNRGSACRSREGELFFGGVNGFNSFFPARLQDDPRTAPVVLTQFKKFDQVESFDRPLASIEAVSLRHDENFFSFEFVALDYAGTENVRYAYKLEGLDPDWTYCGTRRLATYTNVDPGEYVFRVKAANHDGIWGEPGVSVKLTIVPPFWRTWWFSLAGISAALLAAWAWHERRVRTKVKKSLELHQARLAERENVREQIARDYHDEMGHKITKIGLFSELLKANANGSAADWQEHLDKVLESSQSLALDARDFIWALNPEKDSLYEVCLHLQELGRDLFEAAGVDFQLKGLSEELLCIKLAMEWKRHLTLLFKEGMNNVLKHASSKNAVLEVEVREGVLRMSLMDDGVGLSACNGASRSGNGLQNMKRRAQLLRGQLEIQALQGRGTAIHFSSALPAHRY